jgi:hypothetical protein
MTNTAPIKVRDFALTRLSVTPEDEDGDGDGNENGCKCNEE